MADNKNKKNEEKSPTEEMASFCKKKGFVFPSSEIYGGFAGFFDFGPLGSELFKNIKDSFWKFFVRSRDNVVGIEASIISHPRTWIASGHVATFGDMVLVCSKCKSKYRADHFIEENLFIKSESLSAEDIHALIKKHKLRCPECRGNFEDISKFNLLFTTQVGPIEDSSQKSYLRGETAQAMFMDFKLVAETARMKLPFGIAQIGRCFRNEISPRDFLFRSREFTIGEIEFFVHPDKEKEKSATLESKHLNLKISFLSSEEQEKGSSKNNEITSNEITIKQMLKENRLSEWHAYWLAEQILWLEYIGLSKKNLRVREHIKTELSHYASATFDIEYNFPFGFKEIAGNANRGQYDLTQHSNESKNNLQIFDEEEKKNVTPKVIEPTFGIERVFMAALFESFDDDKKRGNIVLHLSPKIAPNQIAVFPLVNKDKIPELSQDLFNNLSSEFVCFYDKSGSIGRRYARQDEIGTPYCLTVDFDSLKNKDVTIRDRDSTNQIRVKIKNLKETLRSLLRGEVVLKDLK